MQFFIIICAIGFCLQVNAKREQNDVIKIGEVVVVGLLKIHYIILSVCDI